LPGLVPAGICSRLNQVDLGSHPRAAAPEDFSPLCENYRSHLLARLGTVAFNRATKSFEWFAEEYFL
jgi:hypothetical protein